MRSSLTAWVGRADQRLDVVRWLPEIYLIVMVVAIVPFLLLQPPFQTPDAYAHFVRALEFSRGQLLGGFTVGAKAGAIVPTSVVKLFQLFLPLTRSGSAVKVSAKMLAAAAALHWSSTNTLLHFRPVGVTQVGSTEYPIVFYIPQILIIEISRILNLSLLATYYAAALANAVCAAAVSYVALRIALVGRAVLFAVVCLPMTLMLDFSVSQDALLLASAALLFGLTSRFSVRAVASRRRYLTLVIGLSALATVITVSRPAYCIFFLTVLIPTPPGYGGSRTDLLSDPGRGRAIRLGGAVYWLRSRRDALLAGGGFAILAVLWIKVSYPTGVGLLVPSYVNSVAQLRYQLSHLVATVGAFRSSVVRDWLLWFHGLIGQFGWPPLGPLFASWVYDLWAGLLVVVILVAPGAARSTNVRPAPSESATISWTTATIGAIVVAGGFLLVIESLFLIDTAVSEKVVQGVQGRYFLPIVPFLGLIAAKWRSVFGPRVSRIMMSAIVGCVLLVVVESARVLLYAYWAH